MEEAKRARAVGQGFKQGELSSKISKHKEEEEDARVLVILTQTRGREPEEEKTIVATVF